MKKHNSVPSIREVLLREYKKLQNSREIWKRNHMEEDDHDITHHIILKEMKVASHIH